MIPRRQFVEAVEATVGTQVRHMGREAGIGLDCVGVALAALAACGSTIAPDDRYQRMPGEEQLQAGLSRYCDELDPWDVQPGDLLQVYYGRRARHVMVLVAQGADGAAVVVHASAKLGTVRRTTIGPETRIRRVWRIREVEHG